MCMERGVEHGLCAWKEAWSMDCVHGKRRGAWTVCMERDVKHGLCAWKEVLSAVKRVMVTGSTSGILREKS